MPMACTNTRTHMHTNTRARGRSEFTRDWRWNHFVNHVATTFRFEECDFPRSKPIAAARSIRSPFVTAAHFFPREQRGARTARRSIQWSSPTRWQSPERSRPEEKKRGRYVKTTWKFRERKKSVGIIARHMNRPSGRQSITGRGEY